VLPGSRPIGLAIPSIDVHSTNIVGLGLEEDGSLEVPRNASAPGWFTPGPSPGQFGPAVIAGHVDSADGPAVFYRLGELRRGDQVKVRRQDRSTAVFVVDRVRSYQKDRFPTREVYGNTTDRAELRLITCSGEYDDKLGYLGNTVVFAHLKAGAL
jgi:sortase (surface protein transpeptidase)